MAVDKANNQGVNQSPSGNDQLAGLAFLRLGDILTEIAKDLELHQHGQSSDQHKNVASDKWDKRTVS
jgi:hypothetical protein